MYGVFASMQVQTTLDEAPRSLELLTSHSKVVGAYLCAVT